MRVTKYRRFRTQTKDFLFRFCAHLKGAVAPWIHIETADQNHFVALSCQTSKLRNDSRYLLCYPGLRSYRMSEIWAQVEDGSRANEQRRRSQRPALTSYRKTLPSRSFRLVP